MTDIPSSREGCIPLDLIPIIIGIIIGGAGLYILSGTDNRNFGLILLGLGLLITGVGGSARFGYQGAIIGGPVGLIMILIGYFFPL